MMGPGSLLQQRVYTLHPLLPCSMQINLGRGSALHSNVGG